MMPFTSRIANSLIVSVMLLGLSAASARGAAYDVSPDATGRVTRDGSAIISMMIAWTGDNDPAFEVEVLVEQGSLQGSATVCCLYPSDPDGPLSPISYSVYVHPDDPQSKFRTGKAQATVAIWTLDSTDPSTANRTLAWIGIQGLRLRGGGK